jgi:hypothetical protein
VQHDGGGWRCLVASPLAAPIERQFFKPIRRRKLAAGQAPSNTFAIIDWENRSSFVCMAP